MRLPDRHSLFWTLLGGIALLSLLVISLHVDVSQRLEMVTSKLSEPTRQVLSGYAEEAEHAWEQGGTAQLDAFLASLNAQGGAWAAVVGQNDQSLSSQPLRGRERNGCISCARSTGRWAALGAHRPSTCRSSAVKPGW